MRVRQHVDQKLKQSTRQRFNTFPLTQAEALDDFGITFDHIWDGGDLNTDLVGSWDLNNQGNEDENLTSHYPRHLSAGLQSGANSGWKGPSATELDITSSRLFLIFATISGSVGSNQNFMVKGAGATRRFDGTQNTAGRLSFTVRDATADGAHVHTMQVAFDHQAYTGPILCGDDENAGEGYIYTKLGSETESTSDVVSKSNASLGRFGGGVAPPWVYHWIGIADGVNGEMSSAARAALFERARRVLG